MRTALAPTVEGIDEPDDLCAENERLTEQAALTCAQTRKLLRELDLGDAAAAAATIAARRRPRE